MVNSKHHARVVFTVFTLRIFFSMFNDLSEKQFIYLLTLWSEFQQQTMEPLSEKEIRDLVNKHYLYKNDDGCGATIKFDPMSLFKAYREVSRLLFLDIDGVLNHSRFEDYDAYVNDSIETPGGFLSKYSIKKLNEITDRSGAKIVLTSTWRPDKNIVSYLKEAGITGEIVGKTPGLTSTPRGLEINKWLRDNIGMFDRPPSYAILDDDADMLLCHQNNYVHVDNAVGLTFNSVSRTLEIFDRDTILNKEMHDD